MTSAESTHGLVPFVVGVTGHLARVRDMDPVERHRLRHLVRDQVFAVLNDPKKFARWSDAAGRPIDAIRLPNTPIVLVTSLADGADRLVVEAATEFANTSGADIRVVPILPQVVRRDAHGAVIDAPYPGFDRLLAPWRDEAIELPQLPSGDAHLQYAFAGHLIAKLARLVVVLRDPTRSDEHNEGGASWVVRAARSGRLDDRRLHEALWDLCRRAGDEPGHPDCARLLELGLKRTALDHFEPCPVLEIDCRSAAERGAPAVEFPQRWLTFLPPVGGELHPGFHDAYHAGVTATDGLPCADCARHAHHRFESFLQSYRRSASNLDRFNERARRASPRASSRLEPDEPPPELRSASDTFRRADEVANRLRAKLDRNRWWMVLLVGISAFFFLMTAHGLAEGDGAHGHGGGGARWFSVAIYLLFLATAHRVHSRTTGDRLESPFWDARALAEGLRVHYYWRRAGVGTAVARNYHEHQKSDVSWVQFALDAIALDRMRAVRNPVPSPDERRSALRTVLACWLGDQLWYYFCAAHVRLRKHAIADTRVVVLLSGSVLFTVWKVVCGLPMPYAALFALCSAGFAAHHLATLDRGTSHAAHDASGRRIGALVILGLVWAVVWLLAAMARSGSIGGLLDDHAFGWTIIAIAAPAVLAGLIHAHAQLSGWSAESRRFQRMIGVYSAAFTRLAEAADVPRFPPPLPADIGEEDRRGFFEHLSAGIDRIVAVEHAVDLATATLESLGRASLAEHADWLMVRRDHPVDLPHAV